MLWHDQTKVGNYDQAIRIPERLHQVLAERQRKTIDLFTARHNRQPTTQERAQMALFPTNIRRRWTKAIVLQLVHKGFKAWIDDLEIGRWVPHQARHSLATSLLRHGASLTHIRKYLGQVSDRMAEHYVTCPIPIWKTCCSRSGWPAPARPTRVSCWPGMPPQ